jgi:hypothetical protein
MERYCKDAQWGQGRRIACLAKHKNQLDDRCRERLTLMQQVFELTQKNLAANRKASKGTKNNPDGQDAKSAKAARPK